MAGSLVTILIPNYKTLALTKLCLRLIRKNTDLSKITVIVIDNDSQDESLDYLRKLTWIDLIERPTVAGEPGFQAHAAALDLGLLRTTTPYVLSIHTDTFVKNPQWLEFLISEIEKSPRIAGVGSWKLESKSFYQRILKSLPPLPLLKNSILTHAIDPYDTSHNGCANKNNSSPPLLRHGFFY